MHLFLRATAIFANFTSITGGDRVRCIPSFDPGAGEFFRFLTDDWGWGGSSQITMTFPFVSSTFKEFELKLTLSRSQPFKINLKGI